MEYDNVKEIDELRFLITSSPQNMMGFSKIRLTDKQFIGCLLNCANINSSGLISTIISMAELRND